MDVEKLTQKMSVQLAMFMICLVISIPLMSGMALAASAGQLSNLEYVGDDGLTGVVRGEDTLRVTVDATLKDSYGDPQEVKPGNVYVTFNQQQESMDECTLGTDSVYECMYNSAQSVFKSNVLPLTVSLNDEAFLPMDTLNEVVVVDNQAPTGSVEVVGGVSLDAPFDLKYVVRDQSCSEPECENKCAGIAEFEIHVGPTTNDLAVVLTQPVDGQVCELEGTITTTVQELGLNSGEQLFCLKARDNFGNEMTQPQCQKQGVDYLPPNILVESFQLLDIETQTPLTHKKSVETKADIRVLVADDQSVIETNDVIADFSSLKPQVSTYNSLNPSSCKLVQSEESEFKVYECVFANIGISASDISEYEISITATDDAGNSLEEVFTISLPTDVTGPRVTELISSFDGFINPTNNTFLATIQEDGVGLFKQDVFLRVGSQDFGADVCSNADGPWKCLFANLTMNLGSQNGIPVTVAVSTELSKDDLGNFFETGVGREMLYDSEAPIVRNATVAPLGAEREVLLGTGEDVAVITANIIEKGDDVSGVAAERAFANFGAFDFTQGYEPAVDCVEDTTYFVDRVNAGQPPEHLYICTWEYAGPISESQVVVDFEVFDLAGNMKTSGQAKSNSISVVDFREVVRDIWEDEFKGSFPTGAGYELNRNSLWMSQQGSPFRAVVELERRGGFTSYVHQFDLSSCQGTLGEVTSDEGFIDVSVQNLNYGEEDSRGRTTRFVLLTAPIFDKEIVEQHDTLTVVCEGSIVQGSSRSSDLFTPNEEFKVTFTVDLVNSIFTRPDSAALDSLLENEDHIENLQVVLDILEFLERWVGQICEMIATIQSLVNNICITINGIAIVYGGVYPWLLDADGQCMLQSDTLNKWWYGGTGEPEFEMWGPFGTDKKPASIGFVCDAFLCTQCNRAWGQMTGVLNEQGGADMWGLAEQLSSKGVAGQSANPQEAFTTPTDLISGLGQEVPTINFDPKRNVIFATMCAPPCLPTIKNFLSGVQLVLKQENKCKVTAYTSGENPAVCEEYTAFLWCDVLTKNLAPWYMVTDFIKQTAAKVVSRVIEYGLFEATDTACQVGNNVGTNGICAGKRAEAAIATVLSIIEMANDGRRFVEQFAGYIGVDLEGDSGSSDGSSDSGSSSGTAQGTSSAGSSSSSSSNSQSSDPSVYEENIGVLPQ